MQHPQPIMQGPNITAGFKNNIIPPQPTIPQQIQPLPIEIPIQPILQSQPIQPQPIQPIPEQTFITPQLPPLPSIPDAYTFFGYELQK